MGWLSRLFGNAGKEPYVVGWMALREVEMRRAKDVTPEMMFAGFIYFVTAFADEDPRSDPRLRAVKAQYANDSSLFELACYLYFRIDSWMYENRVPERELITSVFLREFDALFTKALIPNVQDLFNQRLEEY